MAAGFGADPADAAAADLSGCDQWRGEKVDGSCGIPLNIYTCIHIYIYTYIYIYSYMA